MHTVEIVKQWRYGQDFEFEQYVRQLYDGQTNNLLGYVRMNRPGFAGGSNS